MNCAEARNRNSRAVVALQTCKGLGLERLPRCGCQLWQRNQGITRTTFRMRISLVAVKMAFGFFQGYHLINLFSGCWGCEHLEVVASRSWMTCCSVVGHGISDLGLPPENGELSTRQAPSRRLGSTRIQAIWRCRLPWPRIECDRATKPCRDLTSGSLSNASNIWLPLMKLPDYLHN